MLLLCKAKFVLQQFHTFSTLCLLSSPGSLISSSPLSCSSSFPTFISFCFVYWHSAFKQDLLCGHCFRTSDWSLRGSPFPTGLRARTGSAQNPSSKISVAYFTLWHCHSLLWDFQALCLICFQLKVFLMIFTIKFKAIYSRTLILSRGKMILEKKKLHSHKWFHKWYFSLLK